jgi:hypothetical protein
MWNENENFPFETERKTRFSLALTSKLLNNVFYAQKERKEKVVE